MEMFNYLILSYVIVLFFLPSILLNPTPNIRELYVFIL